jgi:hypothetical protein
MAHDKGFQTKNVLWSYPPPPIKNGSGAKQKRGRRGTCLVERNESKEGFPFTSTQPVSSGGKMVIMENHGTMIANILVKQNQGGSWNMSPRSLSALKSDRRAEPRLPASQYYSVEFSIHGLNLPYQFKIWNMASQSMCVLVREDSELLSRIKVGDILAMRYHTGSISCPWEELRTEIRHITKDEDGRFRGHYLVGLTIVREEGNPTTH